MKIRRFIKHLKINLLSKFKKLSQSTHESKTTLPSRTLQVTQWALDHITGEFSSGAIAEVEFFPQSRAQHLNQNSTQSFSTALELHSERLH